MGPRHGSMTERIVLLISQTASPVGGVETWLDKVCAGLPARGWRPVVGVVRGSVTHRPERFLMARPTLEAVEIDGRGLPAEGRVRAVDRCIRRVRPQVVVPLVVADGHVGTCRAKRAGLPIKYVAPLHGNVPQQIADLRRVASFVDLAVCPGKLTCRLAEWAGVPPERVRHIPNGAESPRHPHVPRQPDQPLRLGYVGRMTQADKRVLDLVSVCRALVEAGVPFSLDIVGDGDQRDQLQNQLATASNSASIRLHGSQSQDFLYEHIYPRLDGLLLFSESESFGIVVYEAMLHGVVPVTSRFLGHAAEGILRDGETGLLFDVGDSRGAADCVRRLSGDADLWSGLSRRARDAVADRFSWQRCVEGWTDTLNEVTELPGRCGPSVPKIGPRRGGHLDAMCMPEAWKDGLRRVRRTLFGVPAAMSGGEEWPWVHQDHDPELLREIDALRCRLDTAASYPPHG